MKNANDIPVDSTKQDTLENVNSEDSDTSSYNSATANFKKSSGSSNETYPQFSVLRSDDGGLRMKISAIRATQKKDKSIIDNNNISNITKSNTSAKHKKKRKMSSDLSSSCCSLCSVSEFEDNTTDIKINKNKKKVKLKKKKIKDTKKVVSDLNDLEKTNKIKKIESSTNISLSIDKSQLPLNDTLNDAGSLSSSDNELVNEAIRRVNASESDTENNSTEPQQQYTSSLLQDFMAKTQMLGSTFSNQTLNENKSLQQSPKLHLKRELFDENQQSFELSSIIKKKRGRPKRTVSNVNLSASDNLETINNTSLSLKVFSTDETSKLSSVSKPDSHSDSLASSTAAGPKRKIDILTLDKQMYAVAERTLYPPKSKRKSSQSKSGVRSHKKVTDSLDPLWKKIDINAKFRRPSLSGYKSDGGSTVCSKILAAKSGYVSDYAGLYSRSLSGYKSDVSGKSYYSTKTCASRAKSCDFRSSRKMRKVHKKRRSLSTHLTMKHTKSMSNLNDQDILQLAGLSLGQSSEESSRESICKPLLDNLKSSKKNVEINRFVTTGEYFCSGDSVIGNRSSSNILSAFSDNGNNNFVNSTAHNKSLIQSTSKITTDQLYNSKDLNMFSRSIRSRRSSAVSGRSSCFSSFSRCKKYRKKRVIDSKMNTEIEILIDSFSQSCHINCDKQPKDKTAKIQKQDEKSDKNSHGKSSQIKKSIKKRKMSENIDFHHNSSNVVKRRHKKAVSSSPDEHKLPLKKRHYLLASREKLDGKHLLSDTLEYIGKEALAIAATSCSAKFTSEALTSKNHAEPFSKLFEIDSKALLNSVENKEESLNKSNYNKNTLHDLSTSKKKNRNVSVTDNVSIKLQSICNTSHNKDKSLKDKKDSKSINHPPPGIFEPSVELEIQIPTSKLHANSIITKSEIDSPLSLNKSLYEPTPLMPNKEGVIETLLNKTGADLLLKRRKRKKINRTGFPTVKKKKLRKFLNENDGIESLDFIEDTKATKTEQKIQNINETDLIKKDSIEEPTVKTNKRGRKKGSIIARKKSVKNEINKKEIIKETNNINKKDNINNNNKLSLSKSASKSNLIEKEIVKRRTKQPLANKIDLIAETIVKQKLIQAKTKLTQKDLKNVKKNIEVTSKEKVKDKLLKTSLVPVSTKKPLSESLTKNSNVKKIINKQIDENLEDEPLPLKKGQTLYDTTSLYEFEPPNNIRKGSKSSLRKSYLVAGLFSDYFKISKTRKNSIKSNGESSDSMDQPEICKKNILPAPPYCEKFFRKTVQDFFLPHDIWLEYKNSKLSKRVNVPSWNYRKIRTNIYASDVVRPYSTNDHQSCNCKLESSCGDDCLNRMVYAECFPSNCPCKEKCHNQKIQKHDIAPGIERFMTENKGWGVRTNLPINKGTYILEYVGEVVTEREFKERMATLYINDSHHYCLHLDGGLVIDGHRMGSDGRFVNHSCLPNCEMQKWSVNGLPRMALFASRNIHPGEELTYDYNFSLFNPSEGQPCRCETPHCRGVIGGKSQRVKVNEPTAITSKNARKRKRKAVKHNTICITKDVIIHQFQQLTDKEKKIVKANNFFLLRNLEKMKKLKGKEDPMVRPLTPSFLAAQISALRTPRNIKTRGLTQASHDPEIEKMAQIAVILKEICEAVQNVKDEDGKPSLTKITSLSRRKRPASNNKNIADFGAIKRNIEKGIYKNPKMFDQDVSQFFENALKLHNSNPALTILVKNLQNAYKEKKVEAHKKLLEFSDEKNLSNFRSHQITPEKIKLSVKEDVIRCLCGLFRDEGLMIQCSQCLVWQHAECTKADLKIENYLCERCEPRKPSLEIPLEEFTEEGYRYYLSLLRGDLQIRQGDTVYVLRDIPIHNSDGTEITVKKHTYETIGKIEYSECDIFRVERLWKNDDGKRFIFGHHYLRPHETFHEPSRKFYPNEVIRVPLYEVVPIELVMDRCWVLDRNTFCKGRPIDCRSENHVYICELRVDKTARFFSRAKQNYITCTKNYAFKFFKDKIKISRSYAPHDINTISSKQNKRKNEDVVNEDPPPKKKIVRTRRSVPSSKTISQKRGRLEKFLLNLRLKHQFQLKDEVVDASYLLSGRGARQRKTLTSATAAATAL